jgi:AAA15 family ATPase/GTPase
MAPRALITSIRLENFKAFIDTGNIPLKPITLLVGKNSAGKSSLIKAILAASQTARQAKLDNSYFRLIGDYTNLGTYGDTVYGNDTTTNFSVGFEVNGPSHKKKSSYRFRYSFSRHETNPLGTSILGVEAYYNNNFICSAKDPSEETKKVKKMKKHVDDIRLSYPRITNVANFAEKDEEDEYQVFLKQFADAMDIVAGEDKETESEEKEIKYSNEIYIRDFILNISKLPKSKKKQKKYQINFGIDDMLSPYIGDTRAASLHLQGVLTRTIYLGPLRDEPTREARLAQSSGNRIGIKGEDLATMLHLRTTKPDFMKKFNSHLQSLGVADSAITSPSYMRDKDDKEVETGFIKILLEHEGTTRSLMDLGFGTSQVLPIIFELSLRRDRLLVIEQPELHLHPAAQSEIGSLLNFSIEQNNQLIVETHSANMIERLKRLIREGQLDNDDINIIYIGKDEENGGSRCDVIGFNEKGEFTDAWPEESFFGEREKEYLDW